MPIYVKRNQDQAIEAIYNQPHVDATEELHDPNHPDILQFLLNNSADKTHAQLVRSDLDFIRVTEDLIEILLQKNVVAITDFAPQVIEKLMQRRGIRTQLDGMSGIFNTDLLDKS